MTFYGLDSAFDVVRPLDCINEQWNPRIFEVGEFSLQVLSSAWDNTIAYIYADGVTDGDNLGLVERLENNKNIKGGFVQVSGKLCSQFLYRLYPVNGNVLGYEGTGSASTLCAALVTTYYNRSRGLWSHIAIAPNTDTSVQGPIPLGGSTGQVNIAGEEAIGQIMHDSLRQYNIGSYVTFDPDTKTFKHHLRDQTDKSSYLMFGVSARTAISSDESADGSAFVNSLVILYGDNKIIDGQAIGRTYLVPSILSGERQAVYQSSVEQGEGESDTDYEARVKLDAVANYKNDGDAEYSNEYNLDFTKLAYPEDYQMGDIVAIEENEAFPERVMIVAGMDIVTKKNETTYTPVLEPVHYSGIGIPR